MARRKTIEQRLEELKNEEFQFKWDLEKTYTEGRIDFEKKILSALIDAKILPEKSSYGLSPDFSNTEDWEIVINKEIVFRNSEELTDKITVRYMKGKLYLTIMGGRLYPSFGFEANNDIGEIKINVQKIKEVLKNVEESKTWATIRTKVEERKIFDRKSYSMKKSMRNEALEILTGKQLGFSENEANTMILSALNHENFKEDMGIEQFIGLTFKMRG